MTVNDPNLIKTPINKTDEVVTRRSEATATTDVNTELGTDLDTDDTPVDTPHVKEGDTAARSPDRRDQEGNAFDGGVNDNSAASVSKQNPQSDDITDRNRYASIDNAQSRVLNETDKD